MSWHLKKNYQKLPHGYLSQQVYSFQPYDKLMIGEGGAAYLAVQPFRLHQLYGLPYIPTSAIKGALRGTWIAEDFGGDEKKRKKIIFSYQCLAG